MSHVLDSSTTAPLTRRHLIVWLGGVVAGSVVLSVGLGYALVTAFSDAAPAPVAGPALPGVELVRDRIAAAPMLAVADSAGRTPNRAFELPAPVALPVGTRTGAVGVRTGFDRTPLGAVAQLAAIDTHVLSDMSLPGAVETYNAWALPGGVGAGGWSQTANVKSFLTSARQQGEVKDATTFVSVAPAAYQVKGVDGDAWVVACVLFDITARITDVARMGYGTCERMQWTPDGWRIAPGTPPAPAPSTWPGSELSVKAGWLPLTRPTS
ncbi:hypothetical protein [Propioniciclava tarda]|uniref:Uncharacterized protein n=1 Tax=Propioniciclava tarda TaxID=433330 RepID=A0A4Q9KKT4_PROTD|nr:hypothetical protein [Propioniciclava tarda]TBT95112.1 hypothetical protein ET996_07590 [Propioniciclava tarda]SMO56513.1 hypothetical protein SAMN06266982_106127 [Propioniciclava tarda]